MTAMSSEETITERVMRASRESLHSASADQWLQERYRTMRQVGRPYAGTRTPAATSGEHAQVFHRLDTERRRALQRHLALGLLAMVGILVPAAIRSQFNVYTLVALGAFAAVALLALDLNEHGHVDAAGVVLLTNSAIASLGEIILLVVADHGVGMGTLPIYGFLALPILLTGILCDRRGTLIMTVSTMSFTLISLTFLPMLPSVQVYVSHGSRLEYGSRYELVVVPLALQGLVALINGLDRGSRRIALLEASRG
ncbi:MAG TPA: hypothetical protein VGR88_09370 [Ktedonobacterales bacterium]|nr:hypothetical protein [Ktedonobacterales bacterium]